MSETYIQCRFNCGVIFITMLKKLLTVSRATNIFRKPKETDYIKSFGELEVPEVVAQFLTQFDNPTQIQAMALKILLNNKDMVGIAPTGSGKTLAFAIPALIKSASSLVLGVKSTLSTVIMCPTRELSNQITQAILPVSRSLHLRIANLYGGAPKREQFNAARSAHVIVATPGRLYDYITSAGTGKLSSVKSLVLDEADRMLQMNFQKELNEAVNQMPKDKQTMLFSATWETQIQQLSRQYLKEDAYYIQVGKNTSSLNPKIEQQFRLANPETSRKIITDILNNQPNTKVIIFCNTKHQTRNVAYELSDHTDRQVNFITSDLTQDERSFVMAKFRGEKASILVATDVASRGIDVKDIDLVVNYGFPGNSSDFIHRIGRTGRAGATGKSLTLIFPRTAGIERNLQQIVKLFKNQSLPVPDNLKNILEELGVQSWDRGSKSGQPRKSSPRRSFLEDQPSGNKRPNKFAKMDDDWE